MAWSSSIKEERFFSGNRLMKLLEISCVMISVSFAYVASTAASFSEEKTTYNGLKVREDINLGRRTS